MLMYKISTRVFVVFLLFIIGVPAEASSPPRYPEDDWQAVSEIVSKRSLSPEWRDSHGHTRIYFQMLYGSESLAARYVRADSKKGIRYEGGVRLLTLAILQGSQQVVQALLSTGETPNSVLANEESPLMLAATYGHLEIMRMLIRAGANVAFSTESKMDALHRALANGKTFAAQLLVDSGLKLDPYKSRPFQGGLIFDAIKGGEIDALHLIASYGFDMNIRNASGETPITYALINGASRHIMEMLVNNGADQCAPNSQGKTPYQMWQRSASSDSSAFLYEGILQKECAK